MLGALPPIFAGLSHEEQQEAAQYLSDVTIEAGETVMAEGEVDPTMAFITSGICEIWRNGVKVGTAATREFIGEIEAFTHVPRVNTVTALHPLHLQVLAPEAYTALAESGNSIVHRLERAVLRRLSDRLHKLDEGIAQYAKGEAYSLPVPKEGLLTRITAPFRRRPAVPEIDPVEALADSDLFSWAPGHFIQDIAEHFTVQPLAADQVLFKQGQPGERAYFIAHGAVDQRLFLSEERAQHLGQVEPGRIFGDEAILLGSPHTYTAIAREEGVALAIDRARFLELHESVDPAASAFRQGIIRNLIQQLIPRMDRYIEALAGATPPDEGLYKGTPVAAVWRD